MRTRKIGVTWAALLVLLAVVLSGALSFVAGFNFHGMAGDYYTSGFRGSPFFVVRLLKAYFAFRVRRYELVDPAKARDLLDTLSSVRVGVYQPSADYELPVLSALKAEGLKASPVPAGTPAGEVSKEYDVLIFPQGKYSLNELPRGEAGRIKAMVRDGVGYIGICAGTIFAKQDLGIVAAEWRLRPVQGLMRVSVLQLPEWGEYAGRSLVAHFANGGYFAEDQLQGWEPLIVSRNLGAVAIRGRYGRGHVVLFTMHPEGGGITLDNQSVFFSGRELQTGGLLLRAILMARAAG